MNTSNQLQQDNQTEAFVTELNENDVLMGRGSPSSDYSGNLRFRQLVIDRREEYLKCTRRNEKHHIAMQIIQTIHDRGGRFLQRITTMEEAEQLRVPPLVQAWKVIDASSPLFVKVKQLMRDVGEETQKKRKIRREEKRREARQQSGSASTASDVAAPLPASHTPVTKASGAAAESGGESKPHTFLQTKRPNQKERLREDSSRSSISSSEGLEDNEQKVSAKKRSSSKHPPVQQVKEEMGTSSNAGDTRLPFAVSPPPLNVAQSPISANMSAQTQAPAGVTVGSMVAAAAVERESQQLTLPVFNSLLQQLQQRQQQQQQQQLQQQLGPQSFIALLLGNRNVVQPLPPPPPPQPLGPPYVSDLVQSVLLSQQQRAPSALSVATDQNPNQPNLEAIALLLNALQQQRHQGQQEPPAPPPS